MASFTETVEKHNPALIATGLAVWGWIIRVVVALSALILPMVVSSMTPLVTYGAQAATCDGRTRTQLATARGDRPEDPGRAPVHPGQHAARRGGGRDRQGVRRHPGRRDRPAPRPRQGAPGGPFPRAARHAVQNAAAAAPGQWKNWWWVCVGGEVLFLPFIFIMTGRWSPRKAKQDADEHEAKVQAELAALGRT